MESIKAPQDSAGYAALTIVQLLIEHLVEKEIIDFDAALEIYRETAERYEEVAADASHPELMLGAAGFARQLLEAAQRERADLPPRVTGYLDAAISLARTHLVEARRSVGVLRPPLVGGRDITAGLRRVTETARLSSSVPIELVTDALPTVDSEVEREIIGIAQEALTNATRHARAKQITVSASAQRTLGLRLLVVDDGRGIASDRAAGFGMASMQERADRIGASLTIVTAPRAGTQVVLAWEPPAAGQ